MSAIESISRICETQLVNADFRYCLVTEKKLPIRFDETQAKPNNVDDFVGLELLTKCEHLAQYAGVGISIQASDICAIDVDHCFTKKNDVSSGDERATTLLNMFDDAYCEFSFSGTGLRILFTADKIDDYSLRYYIKNQATNIEYYQPYRSFRYVTITGNVINDVNPRDSQIASEKLLSFLNKYMLKQTKKSSEILCESSEIEPLEKLLHRVKCLYLKDNHFQNQWFANAPGSGKNESELDYALLSILYEKITQNKLCLRELFECSPYFKSKDSHHVYKWNNQEHRYFEYVYGIIQGRHFSQ